VSTNYFVLINNIPIKCHYEEEKKTTTRSQEHTNLGTSTWVGSHIKKMIKIKLKKMGEIIKIKPFKNKTS